MPTITPPPYDCLFEIDGVWVKAQCVRLAADVGGGWLVEVDGRDMPDGNTKLQRPIEPPQFEVAEGDMRLKVLGGD